MKIGIVNWKIQNKTRYEDAGSGEPVILMHGWTSSHNVYAEPVKKLRHKARCITYDHRGHSGSKEAFNS